MLQEIQNVRIFVPRKHYEDFILNINNDIHVYSKHEYHYFHSFKKNCVSKCQKHIENSRRLTSFRFRCVNGLKPNATRIHLL